MSLDKFSLFDSSTLNDLTVVQSYNQYGVVVNGVILPGAVLLLPETSFLWNVNSLEDITPDSLKVLTMVTPRIEVCILGTGKRTRRPSPELISWFSSQGISLDFMDSVNAFATFNVLTQEGRNAAAACLPADNFEQQMEALKRATDKPSSST